MTTEFISKDVFFSCKLRNLMGIIMNNANMWNHHHCNVISSSLLTYQYSRGLWYIISFCLNIKLWIHQTDIFFHSSCKTKMLFEGVVEWMSFCGGWIFKVIISAASPSFPQVITLTCECVINQMLGEFSIPNSHPDSQWRRNSFPTQPLHPIGALIAIDNPLVSCTHTFYMTFFPSFLITCEHMRDSFECMYVCIIFNIVSRNHTIETTGRFGIESD